MEIWRFFGLVLFVAVFDTSFADSDPMDHFQDDFYDTIHSSPGEPLTPLDFQNGQKITNLSPPMGHGNDDPIEIAGLYEGDILISHSRILGSAIERNGIIKEEQKWKYGTVPYLISSDFSETDRSNIARAIAEFHLRTCIVFQPRKTERDYVHIVKGQGCSSPVGRVGGVQQVTLGEGCVYPGIVSHELMHAVGFWHEQSRWDRDDFVTVYFQNIKPGMEFNFQKYSWENIQNLSVPYDTTSIMHYGPYAFSKERNLPTILPKNPNDHIGQRKNFSKIDVLKINKLYNCLQSSETGNNGSSSHANSSHLNNANNGTKPRPPSNLATPSPPAQEKCSDSHRNCKGWAEMGECSSNPSWMLVNCKKSCSQCGAACSDMNENCAAWSKNGECTRNPSYMITYCAKSCKRCDLNSQALSTGNGQPICEDKEKTCAAWASKGECDRNAKYMTINCPKSCKACKR